MKSIWNGRSALHRDLAIRIAEAASVCTFEPIDATDEEIAAVTGLPIEEIRAAVPGGATATITGIDRATGTITVTQR